MIIERDIVMGLDRKDFGAISMDACKEFVGGEYNRKHFDGFVLELGSLMRKPKGIRLFETKQIQSRMFVCMPES